MKSDIKNKVLVLLAILLSQSCEPNLEFEHDKTPFFGNELRINGYYYYDKEDYANIIFFYRNGTVYQTYQPKLENENNRQKIDMNNIHARWGWGRFNITDTNIGYEYWGTSGCYAFVGQYIGTIDNDSTYTITRLREQKYNNSFKKVSQTYRFRVFENKPDSTLCKE